jgi:hypothetical protein
MTSYYYIMDENFGASSKNLDEARQNAINSAEKELNYEVKMAAALAIRCIKIYFLSYHAVDFGSFER